MEKIAARLAVLRTILGDERYADWLVGRVVVARIGWPSFTGRITHNDPGLYPLRAVDIEGAASDTCLLHLEEVLDLVDTGQRQ